MQSNIAELNSNELLKRSRRSELHVRRKTILSYYFPGLTGRAKKSITGAGGNSFSVVLIVGTGVLVVSVVGVLGAVASVDAVGETGTVVVRGLLVPDETLAEKVFAAADKLAVFNPVTGFSTATVFVSGEVVVREEIATQYA